MGLRLNIASTCGARRVSAWCSRHACPAPGPCYGGCCGGCSGVCCRVCYGACYGACYDCCDDCHDFTTIVCYDCCDDCHEFTTIYIHVCMQPQRGIGKGGPGGPRGHSAWCERMAQAP